MAGAGLQVQAVSAERGLPWTESAVAEYY